MNSDGWAVRAMTQSGLKTSLKRFDMALDLWRNSSMKGIFASQSATKPRKAS